MRPTQGGRWHWGEHPDTAGAKRPEKQLANQAMAAPRIAFIEPDRMVVEEGIAATIREQLAARGHQIGVGSIGNAHGLTIEYDSAAKPVLFQGASDPRGKESAQTLMSREAGQ